MKLTTDRANMQNTEAGIDESVGREVDTLRRQNCN